MNSILKIVVNRLQRLRQPGAWPTLASGLSWCRRAVLGVTVVGALAACGQKGPLTLPSPPAPAASAAASR